MAEYGTADLRRQMGTGLRDLMSEDRPKKKKRDWRSDMDAPGAPGLGMPRGPDLMTEAGPYDPARSIGERALTGLLDYGPLPAKMATAMARQPITAAEAAGEAAFDPSIANLTKAGVETAMAAMPLSPARALRAGVGSLAAGYGAAVAKDTQGFGLMGSASAADDGLNDAQRKRMTQLQRKGSLSRAEREEKNSYLAIQAKQQEIAGQAAAREREIAAQTDAKRQGLMAEQEAAKKASEQQEFERAVNQAEGARAAEFAKDKSFKDSEVGKVYEKTGGFAPMLMGVGAGMVHRLAAGPGKTAAQKYAIPAAEGTGLTFAGMNAPLVYDTYNTPTVNPQRAGEEAYARLLPPGHPRKAEAAAYAQGLPQENPVMRIARDELTNPQGAARRLGAAIMEGAPAGVIGSKLPDAGKAVVRGVGSAPGLLAEGYHRGMARSNEARGISQAVRADADAAALAAAEAQRRIGGQTGGAPPAAAAPGIPGGQPPQPAPLQNPSLPLPPPNQMAPNIPAPAMANQGLMAPPMQQPQQMLAMPPEVMDLVRKLGDRMDAPPAPRAVPSGAGKPGRVGWANTWSDPARDVMAERARSGGTIRGGRGGWSAESIQSAIAAKLPEGVKPPSVAKINEQRRKLEMATGSTPAEADLVKIFAKDKKRELWAVPAGGVGLGLMGGYPSND